MGTVYTTTDPVIAYYNKISHGELNKMVPVSNKKVLMVMATMYFRKHSCLVPTMNEHVGRFLAHGFVSKWLHDNGFKLRKSKNEREPQILTLDQVLGLFYICIGLYIISILLFIGELIAFKCGKYFNGKKSISKRVATKKPKK